MMRHLWLWCRSSPGLSLADFPSKLDKDCRHFNEICRGIGDGHSRHSRHFCAQHNNTSPSLPGHIKSCHFSWLTWAMVRKCLPKKPWCSHTRAHTHTHRAASVTSQPANWQRAVGARRSPAQTVGLRIRLLVSRPSHTAASLPNARISIRTGEHQARLARGCSCIRLLHTYGVAEGFYRLSCTSL